MLLQVDASVASRSISYQEPREMLQVDASVASRSISYQEPREMPPQWSICAFAHIKTSSSSK